MTLLVDYEELEDSPTFSLTGQRPSAKRIFLVDWSDWQEAVAQIYGSYQYIAGQATHTPPETFPGMPWLVAQDIQVEPFDPKSPDGAGAPNTYNMGGAKLTVTYSPIEGDGSTGGSHPDMPEVDNGTYLTYSADIGAKMLSVPGRTFLWSGLTGADRRLPDDQPMGKLIPTEQFTLSWQRVPRPPFSQIRAKRGMVNDGEFMGFPDNNVLFLGAKLSRDFQVIDSGLWRVDYMFEVRSHKATSTDPALENNYYGWNRFYSRKSDSDGEHWLIIADEDGNQLYQDTDFAPLLQQGD